MAIGTLGNRGDYVIDGRWRVKNVGGSFSFKVNSRNGRLNGHYTHDGARYDWNGSRRQAKRIKRFP